VPATAATSSSSPAETIDGAYVLAEKIRSGCDLGHVAGPMINPSSIGVVSYPEAAGRATS